MNYLSIEIFFMQSYGKIVYIVEIKVNTLSIRDSFSLTSQEAFLKLFWPFQVRYYK
jgi:hypothetical protein